jgi:hypothetical protein
MLEAKLLQQMAQKEADAEEIADKIIKKPELLSEIFQGLSADEARIKYGCAKVLRIISEKEPEVLYPEFHFLAELLNSDRTFLRWDAIQIIANLAAVDSENRVESIFDQYFAPIPGPVMITGANVIRGAAKIALAKPQLTERIVTELLKVEKARYQTTECRNIALGHAIKSFDQFFDQIKDKEPVIELVKKQLKNKRNSTRKKAELFIRKHNFASFQPFDAPKRRSTAPRELSGQG